MNLNLDRVPEELRKAFVRMLGDKNLPPKDKLFAINFLNTGKHRYRVLALLVNYQC
jgi:hypothetical protein